MNRFVFLLLSCLVASSNAFSVLPSVQNPSQTSLNLFGGLGDAFKNDDKLGERKNEGLKGGVKYNEQILINGKSVKAVVGQPIKAVANSARVKIQYDCQKGDCGTCMIKMNGRKVKACQMKVPAGKCVIETL